ncbi:hypothetical protein BDY24DRAFT_375075 [Mrakia frigida]|uniref:uncharacterized protein n=1 Tax=Mrakia frigida TaxID=29902 RepID=UPI003FCC1545
MKPSSLTIPKLKAELDARKIAYKSTLKKAGLVELLQAALDKEAEEKEEDRGEGASTSKKRKERDSEGGGENAEASTSTSKPTKSKKPKPTVKAPTPPPAPPPPLPPTILNLIKSYLSPLDLRSHLAFSGTSKHIRKTCYGSEQAWKEIVLGAGFGKPSSVRTGGGGEGGEWKEVARKLVNCLAYGFGERGTLDDGWEGFRHSLLASKSTSKPLTPEDVVSDDIILETNPLFRTVLVANDDWSSIQNVVCDFESKQVDDILGGESLKDMPAIGYALATCPVVTHLGVEQGFSSVKNVDGVTILDVWTALVNRANEPITEAQLLSKFVRDQDLKDSNKNTWSYLQRNKWHAWLSTTDMRAKGCALMKSLMVEPDESFNGDVFQAQAGSILLSLGFDEAEDHGSEMGGGSKDSY